MMRVIVALGLCSALLAGCEQPVEPEVQLTHEQVSVVQQKWQGNWVGAFGSCPVTTTVSDVTGSSAKVVYSYGSCGSSSPGSFVDYNAEIADDVLTADIGFATVVYELQGPETAAATFTWDRGGRGSSSGTFRREG